jgi:hypothetical protein
MAFGLIAKPGGSGTTTTARQGMTMVQTNAGESWWNVAIGSCMLTVSYDALHTPRRRGGAGVLS